MKRATGRTTLVNYEVTEESSCIVKTVKVLEKEPKTDVVTLIPDMSKDSPYYFIETNRVEYKGQKLKANEYLAMFDEDGEEDIYCDLKGSENLVNNLVDRGFCTKIEDTVGIMNAMSKATNELKIGNLTRDSVLCASCAKKVGVKKCSGCSSPTRYCSQACQVADWPFHKPSCGGGKKKKPSST